VNNPKLLSHYSSSIAAELKAAETENDLLKKSLGAGQDAKPGK